MGYKRKCVVCHKKKNIVKNYTNGDDVCDSCKVTSNCTPLEDARLPKLKEMKYKVCSRCKIKHPATNRHFWVNSRNKDKLHNICKGCTNVKSLY